MLENQSPVVQALLGTMFTWALTFLGSAMAIFIEVGLWTVLVISYQPQLAGSPAEIAGYQPRVRRGGHAGCQLLVSTGARTGDGCW